MLAGVVGLLIILVQLALEAQVEVETQEITMLLVNKMERLILVVAVVVMKATTTKQILLGLLEAMEVREL